LHHRHQIPGGSCKSMFRRTFSGRAIGSYGNLESCC
jgi:hypothetical protein